MARRQRFTTDQVAAALRACGGFRSHAAANLGCSPSTITNCINRSARLQQIDKEIVEAAIDTAEDQLLKLVRRGNVAAVIFLLKTKAKHRGYVERQEISGPEGGPVEASLHFESLLRLTAEERAAKIEALQARIAAGKARLADDRKPGPSGRLN